MAKTLIDVDEDLLVEATTALGTATKKDTDNGALRQAVETSREKRRRALEDLQRIADESGFDFDRLDGTKTCETRIHGFRYPTMSGRSSLQSSVSWPRKASIKGYPSQTTSLSPPR